VAAAPRQVCGLVVVCALAPLALSSAMVREFADLVTQAETDKFLVVISPSEDSDTRRETAGHALPNVN